MNPSVTSRISQIFCKHHQLLLLLCLSFAIWMLETLLVAYRFALFDADSSGANQLDLLEEKLGFIVLSASIDFLLSAILLYLWYRLWRRKKTHSLLLSYHFVMLWGSFYLFAVIAKFKVLSYFNDTISFALVTNLSGGHLFQALYFILDEALGVMGLLVLFLAIYLLGHIKVRRAIHRGACQGDFATPISRLSAKYLFLAMPVLILLVMTNQNSGDVRYALRQTLSFYWLSQVIVALTDVDGDGYSAYVFPKDSAPFNAAINPNAVDIPNNGIDEDGMNGDLVYRQDDIHDGEPQISTNPQNSAKHVVVLVLESTRADVIGKTLDGIAVAPTINKLANSGSSLVGVYSHSGYTTTSIKALLNQSLIKGDAQGHAGLADFHQKDYQISVFSGQSEEFGDIANATGMRKYADVFFDADDAREDRVYGNAAANSNRIDARRVFSEFEKHAKGTNWNRPQFIYINLQCAHFPYYHSKMPHLLLDNPIPRHDIGRDNKIWLEKSYWNSVQYADQVVADIIAVIKRQHAWDNTLLIITGDHGESLFDDGFLGHGHAINDIQTEVPLVFNIPGVVMEKPIGQNEILNVARRWAGLPMASRDLATEPKLVFQYIGSISSPAQIAIVDKLGVRTLFDFRNRKIWFSDLKRWQDIEPTFSDITLATRAKTLINTWETLNWLAYRATQ